MTDQAPITNWQSIGDLAAALVEEKTRQRSNAPGRDRQGKDQGDE